MYASTCMYVDTSSMRPPAEGPQMVEAQLAYLTQRGSHDIEMLRNHATIESCRLVRFNIACF